MAMNNRVLSIEIGNSFTKICEMDYKVKKPKVYKVLTVETPEGIVVDGMLQPTQEYADHLVNALGTASVRRKCCLPFLLPEWQAVRYRFPMSRRVRSRHW